MFLQKMLYIILIFENIMLYLYPPNLGHMYLDDCNILVKGHQK